MYYFETESLSKIKGVFDLTKSHIHSLDDSYFQRKMGMASAINMLKKKDPAAQKRLNITTPSQVYYFQIVTEERDEKVAVHFSASSREERDEWLSALSSYTRCCDFCDGIPSSPFQRFRISNDCYRKITNVTVTVKSARDLQTVDVIRGKCDPFCVIQLNDIDFARTSTKWHTNQPLWEENFVFESEKPFPLPCCPGRPNQP